MSILYMVKVLLNYIPGRATLTFELVDVVSSRGCTCSLLKTCCQAGHRYAFAPDELGQGHKQNDSPDSQHSVFESKNE